jgi:hypothetical protein
MTRTLALAATALLLAACTQHTPQTPFPTAAVPTAVPPPAAASEPVIFAARGTVQSVSIDNFGRPTSFILKSGESTRVITFPAELAVPVGGEMAEGDTIQAVIARIGFAADNPAQPVYRLMSIRDKNGRIYAAPSMASNRYARVEGTIKELRAEASGLISTIQLDSGDIIRITPRMASQNPLTVGDNFSANGPSVYLPTGGRFVFAEEINGLTMRALLPPGGWGRPMPVDDGSGGYDESGMEGMDFGEGY